jgi:hypothetical protein
MLFYWFFAILFGILFCAMCQQLKTNHPYMLTVANKVKGEISVVFNNSLEEAKRK